MLLKTKSVFLQYSVCPEGAEQEFFLSKLQELVKPLVEEARNCMSRSERVVLLHFPCSTFPECDETLEKISFGDWRVFGHKSTEITLYFSLFPFQRLEDSNHEFDGMFEGMEERLVRISCSTIFWDGGGDGKFEFSNGLDCFFQTLFFDADIFLHSSWRYCFRFFNTCASLASKMFQTLTALKTGGTGRVVNGRIFLEGALKSWSGSLRKRTSVDISIGMSISPESKWTFNWPFLFRNASSVSEIQVVDAVAFADHLLAEFQVAEEPEFEKHVSMLEVDRLLVSIYTANKGCSMRCPYCHSRVIVSLPVEDVFLTSFESCCTIPNSMLDCFPSLPAFMCCSFIHFFFPVYSPGGWTLGSQNTSLVSWNVWESHADTTCDHWLLPLSSIKGFSSCGWTSGLGGVSIGRQSRLWFWAGS